MTNNESNPIITIVEKANIEFLERQNKLKNAYDYAFKAFLKFKKEVEHDTEDR